MKKVTRSLMLASALVATTTASAFVDEMCPLVGIDYKQVWMQRYRHPFGYNSDTFNGFAKSYPGATVYLGTRFCENLGLELGFDWNGKKKNDFTFRDGTTSYNATTSVRRRAGYLDFVGYMPVAECFELMGTVGIGYVNAKANVTITPEFNQRTSNSTFKSAVGRVRVGGNYMFTDCIGARALIGWESTASLKGRLPALLDASIGPFKDSLSLAAGLFFKF